MISGLDVAPGQATAPVFARRELPAFPRSDRYTYVAMIGQGGMGVIYRAFDRELGHEVALKVLRARGHDAAARLKAEFRARADFHHPHLLQLLDLVVTDEHAFFTMELVDTIDFLDWIWLEGEAGVRRRLAAALGGVVSALAALHAAGFVHFDVKPANILVDRTGRAVLADFGLSTAIRSRAGGPARDLEGLGTPDYMAPERHRGGAVMPASDLYSVGAVIVEALTGSLHDDLEPRDDDPLLALARRLMAPDPEARPTAGEVAAGLAALVTSAPAARALAESPLVGREPQLAALAAAFARVDASTVVVGHVHGASGIGKTALVRRFLDQIESRCPAALVLHGRCHPYEQIAFGGVDRIVEGLAAAIRDGELSIAGIAPRALAALVRLFPAMPWQIPAATGALADDDRGLRLLGVATLRELLVRAAAARPLVMWIDDLHWIDDDTEEVVAGIGHIPNSMVIYSYRPEHATRFTTGSAPATGGPRVHRVDVDVGALDVTDLESLVRAVAPGVSRELCRDLAIAARGYPVFARVLAQHGARRVESFGVGDAGSLTALWNQLIDGLPPAQRALFDAIAVAPGPVAASIVSTAAGVRHAAPELRTLEQLGIVTRAPGRGAMRVAPFHDQLRQLRLEHLDTTARARLHRELARGHERVASTDYEALVHHCHELGEHARAGHYAVLAADRASASLAFGAAAGFYASAIDWLPDRGEPWELHRKLAECQANRGHAEDAGLHFERAAILRTRGDGPSAAATRDAMRAAEQLLRCGRIPDGYRLMRDVLATLRVRLPGSHRTAVLRSLVLRARLVLRGLDAAPVAELDPTEELRMDALWMASTSLGHLNHALADVLLLHHVRAALDHGTPSRILRSLTYEAAAEITIGLRFFDRRAADMLARAERLLAVTRDDYDRGWYEASYSAIAFFRADLRETIAHAELAEHHLLRRAIGVAWERAVVHSYWLFALALTGKAVALDERRRIALEDALARRDRLAESHCRSGYTALTWLFRDDVAGARRDRATLLGAVHREHRDRAGTNRWPESAFGTPDYHALLADCHIELYAGDAAAAHARIESAWPLMERALLLRIAFVNVDLRFLRARCALAASIASPRRRTLRRLAARECARIARDRNPIARPCHALLRGLLAADAEALADAERGFDELAMIGHAAAARFRRGELVGGADGDRLRSDACERLRAAGIARPERIIEMYAPRAPA